MTKEDTMTEITPPKPCTKTEAKALTDRIKASIDTLASDLLQAYERKAWQALGYETWDAYVKAELPIKTRRAYQLLDQERVIVAVREAAGDVQRVAHISARDAAAVKDDLPAVTAEIKARVEAGEKPQKAASDVIAEQRAAKAAAKAAREAQQAENDRQRELARAALPDSIKRAEQAKAANGSHHAAVVGKQPTPPAETPEQIAAHRDELLEENEALRKDVEELTRKLAAYDDRVVLWERAGLDGIEASYKEQIKVLERRVEEATADRAKAIRQRDYWKKQAMSLGYVSPNAETANADEWSPF